MFRSSLLAFTCVAALGCDHPPTPEILEPADSHVRTVAEERGLVDFLADHEVSTEQVLDQECGLRSDTAWLVDRYRRGPDGYYGTDDDREIDSEATLDSIRQVGAWTIEQLYLCAEEFGYVVPGCVDEGPWQRVLRPTDDWQDLLPPELVDVIEEQEGRPYLCNPSFANDRLSSLASITVHYQDCDVASYEVQWRHGVSVGVEEIQTYRYDAELRLFDGRCEF